MAGLQGGLPQQAGVHLAHHIRKGESEDKMPGKFDAKGAGAITDMVDNVFIVWHNKKAERDSASREPTAMLGCEKQRNGAWEGVLGFRVDPQVDAYPERFDGLPMRYALEPVSP